MSDFTEIGKAAAKEVKHRGGGGIGARGA
ncbi:hypothetical protein SimranZ1_92 [Mycobacterium phage SimranZ1]|nr:hypothetical protein SimranZ1_92 [Mycobacterium phage SimranZ1]